MRNVIIATTYFPSTSDGRYLLALKMLEEARIYGYPVILVDSSPVDDVAQGFEETEGDVMALRVPSEMALGAKHRIGLKFALNAGHNQFALIQPEKYPLVASLEKLFQAVSVDGRSVAVPQRQSFASYPSYQASLEPGCNAEANKMMGTEGLDLWFGSQVVDMDGALIWLRYKGEFGIEGCQDFWESPYIVVCEALAQGLGVVSVPIDYTHPVDQKLAEEHNDVMDRKRDVQKTTLLKIIAAACLKLGLPRR